MSNIRNKDWTQEPITFFFGAGATKAVAPDAPLGDELLPAILKFTEENDPEIGTIIQKTHNFIDDFYSKRSVDQNSLPRIEDVLSLLDLYTKERVSLTRDFRYEDIIELKNDLIFIMCKVLDKELREEQCTNIEVVNNFADKINKISNPKITFISTNYDIVLDNTLYKLNICNYGVIIRTVLERERLNPNEAEMSIGIGGQERFFKAQSRNVPFAPWSANKGKIPLFKIHGSLNWLWCPRCEELDITVYEKGVLRTQRHNYLCASQYCTSPYEFLIVTPTMFKVYDNRIIKEVWEGAEKSISASKYLVFIGYSLPEADIHIRCMLTRAIANVTARPRILVIDYDQGNNSEHSRKVDDTKKRYKRLLGNNVRFVRYGFQEFVNDIDTIMTNLLSNT